MYKKELQSLLNSPKFPNYFLLFGSEAYQVELFTKEILDKFDDENRLDIYFDEYDFNVARSHISETSLFCNSNVLHIKADKNIPTKELKTLIEICKKNENSAFIYEFYENEDKISFETQKAFGVNFARFFIPGTPNEAINLLSYHAQKLGVNATNVALYQIYTLQNESLYLASSELNKLASLTKNVDENIVNQLVFSLNGVNFETFFDKIISLQNIKDDFINYMSDPNLNEMAFVNSLYSSFFRLFRIQTYVKIYGEFDLKKAIGYLPPPNVVNQLKRQALGINTELYMQIFQFLNLTEYDLKTKKDIEKESFLLSSILSIQNLIAKNRKS